MSTVRPQALPLARRLRYGASIVKAWALDSKRPLNVSFFITNRCNLRCAYCDIPVNRHFPEMSTRQIAGMLDEFSRLGMLKFSCSGGEPLLREDLGEVLDHAASLGVVTSITTNGKLLPRRAAGLQRLNTMLLSLDGDQDFQRCTKNNDVDQILRSVELVRSNGTQVWLSTVALSQTGSQLDFLFGICRDLGLKLLLQPFQGELIPGRAFDQQATQQQLSGLFRRALDKAPDLLANTPDYVDMILQDQYLHPPRCLAGRRTCFINSNGDVFPCLPLLLEAGAAPNGLELGWEKAFAQTEVSTCQPCRFPCQAELYFTFSLRWRTWLHMQRSV
ncbi:MAG: radical SAM protein [Desulfarculus sp.]|nr:radical SAM protein [Desulfarculus sp.]